MILFAHTKFGLVPIQGSRVKRGGGIRPPRSERVFQIPVQIGLNESFIPLQNVLFFFSTFESGILQASRYSSKKCLPCRILFKSLIFFLGSINIVSLMTSPILNEEILCKKTNN